MTIAPSGVRPLVASLGVGGLILVFAVVRLGLEGNGPKVLRVSAAGVTYGVIVVGLLRAARGWAASDDRVPFWPFAMAGAVAGLVSGVMRPEQHVGLTVTSIVAAAFLLAGVHWLAVRTWSRVRRAITA